MTLRTSRTGTHSGPIPPAAQPAALSPLHPHTARVWRAVAGRLSKAWRAGCVLSEQHAPTLTRRPDSRVFRRDGRSVSTVPSHVPSAIHSIHRRWRCAHAGDAIRAMRASLFHARRGRLQQATFQALASWLSLFALQAQASWHSLFALQAQAGVLVDREEIVEAR